MQLDLRHVAELNAKRYRENLSFLRGYEAVACADQPLPAKYADKAIFGAEREPVHPV